MATLVVSVGGVCPESTRETRSLQDTSRHDVSAETINNLDCQLTAVGRQLVSAAWKTKLLTGKVRSVCVVSVSILESFAVEEILLVSIF